MNQKLVKRRSLAAFCAAVAWLGLLPAGCATNGAEPGPSVGDRTSIARDELEEVQGTNLYDVLQRARPLWLISSGARSRSINARVETAVITDGRYFGGIETLRQLPVAGVRVVRYATGSNAAHTYAGALVGRHVDAVISVEFGSDPPPTLQPDQ